jgi:hypothetical protein
MVTKKQAEAAKKKFLSEPPQLPEGCKFLVAVVYNKGEYGLSIRLEVPQTIEVNGAQVSVYSGGILRRPSYITP